MITLRLCDNQEKQSIEVRFSSGGVIVQHSVTGHSTIQIDGMIEEFYGLCREIEKLTSFPRCHRAAQTYCGFGLLFNSVGLPINSDGVLL